MEQLERPKVYFHNLDIFRFIAAYMIVIFHAYDSWKGWIGPPKFMSLGDTKTLTRSGFYIDNFFHNFPIAVDIFFLISGFLITYLLLVERENYGKINIFKFYARRTLRIWPLYFLIIALTPLFHKYLGKPEPPYLWYVTFMANFNLIETKWVFPSIQHLWSICIEEHFYIFWPIVLAFIPKKHMLTFFLLVIAISIGYRAHVVINKGADWYTLYLHTLSRWDSIAFGSLLGWLHFKKPFQFNIALPTRLIVYAILVLLLFVDNEGKWDDFFLATMKKFTYLTLFAFWIGNYLFNPNALFVFRKKNFLHYLGKVSYGIYMFQSLVVTVVIEKYVVGMQHFNLYQYMGLVILGSILVPVISYELYEKLFLRFKKHFEVVKTRV